MYGLLCTIGINIMHHARITPVNSLDVLHKSEVNTSLVQVIRGKTPGGCDGTRKTTRLGRLQVTARSVEPLWMANRTKDQRAHKMA